MEINKTPMPIFKKTKTAPSSGNIVISYSILGIGLIIVFIIVGGIGVFDLIFKWNILLREYIAMSAFGCVTIGLIYNATALQYNYELNKYKLEQLEKEGHHNKVKFTYEAISDWYKNDMATNAEITRRFIKPFKGTLSNTGELEKFKTELSKDENVNTRKSIISVLNFFEHLALLKADGVINEEILKKAFRTAFITLYSNLKEYIEDEQRGNSGANAKIYINFVELAKKWLSE